MARPGDGGPCDPALPNEVGGDDGTGGSWTRRAEYAVGMRIGAGNNRDRVGAIGASALCGVVASFDGDIGS